MKKQKPLENMSIITNDKPRQEKIYRKSLEYALAAAATPGPRNSANGGMGVGWGRLSTYVVMQLALSQQCRACAGF